jgi:hypothetical protein
VVELYVQGLQKHTSLHSTYVRGQPILICLNRRQPSPCVILKCSAIGTIGHDLENLPILEDDRRGVACFHVAQQGCVIAIWLLLRLSV